MNYQHALHIMWPYKSYDFKVQCNRTKMVGIDQIQTRFHA